MGMSLLLQIIGTAAGITGAILTVFKNKLCWIAYSISNISFTTLFLVEQIYIPILQYLVFMSINVAGWLKWRKDEKRSK